MARPFKFKHSLVISVRIEADDYQKLQEIAALETINSGKKICTQDLIRDAIKFVYEDNERLRECFRRSKARIYKKFK